MHEPPSGRPYEIRVCGHLGPTLLEAFPELTSEPLGDETLLRGWLADQSALFGVLCELDALGIELREVRAVAAVKSPCR